MAAAAPYLKAVRWAIQDALDETEEGEEEGAGAGGGDGDGDRDGGLDEEEVAQRPLAWQALSGMFHHGVDKDGPFVRGDVGDVVDDADALVPVPEPHL